MLRGEAALHPPKFTITSNVHEYNCVKSSFFRAGFLRDDVDDDWCAMWTKHLKEEDYARMNPYQKVRFGHNSLSLQPVDPCCLDPAAQPLPCVVEFGPQGPIVPEFGAHASRTRRALQHFLTDVLAAR